MQLSATHTTNTQLFSQFLPFFNIPELKFADLRLFWFLRISREFSRNFTSRSRSRGIFISLFTLDLDLKEFSFHFSFSISISRYFHFTFHSRNEWNWFSFHFSLLELPISTLAGHWCRGESSSDYASSWQWLLVSKQEWVSHLQIMFLLVLHNDCTMYVNDYLISTYIMLMSILVRFSNPIATGKASEAGNLQAAEEECQQWVT